MGRFLRLTMPLLMTLLVAGCVPNGFGPLNLNLGSKPASNSDNPPPDDKGFAEQLAYGYGLLADYDDYIADDADAAAHFRDKAARAKAGVAVEPDPATGGDTGKALGMLLDARRNQTSGHTTDFAEAQLNYDCWVDRLDRHDKSAALCREKFYKAYDRIGVMAASSAPEQQLVSQQQQQPEGEGQRFAVYFGKGKATPDAEAFGIIRQAASAFVDKPGWRIHLTGHASGEKNRKADILLSMRRAIAVRNALLQNGVDADKIVIGAVGATGSAGREKASGESESGSVDIAVVQVDKDQPDVGPDITKIAPQYFGKNATDQPDQ